MYCMGRHGYDPYISLAHVVSKADTPENAVKVFDLIDELIRKRGFSGFVLPIKGAEYAI